MERGEERGGGRQLGEMRGEERGEEQTFIVDAVVVELSRRVFHGEAVPQREVVHGEQVVLIRGRQELPVQPKHHIMMLTGNIKLTGHMSLTDNNIKLTVNMMLTDNIKLTGDMNMMLTGNIKLTDDI